jgi:hypothetical protein
MNNRLKEIDMLVESFFPQKEHNLELENKINKFYNTYKKELKNYNYVSSKEELFQLKLAGYIRYFDRDDNIKFGGILIKIFESETDSIEKKRTLLLLQNSDGKKWTISWENNIIFYKPQTKKGDNLRNLFISLLDKEEYSD